MTDPPASERHRPGDIIGEKYRLEQKLGEGGMGSVWAARNVTLDSAVAIKVIRGEVNREALAPRLLQEARAAAKLGHPAIVRVFDVGQTEQGDPFIVMELLEGESLRGRLERVLRLPSTETVQLLLPIADALRAAHAKGIVHRDIKPDNVFLVEDEHGLQPKLVDFGIAKFEELHVDTHLTGKGVILGSPDYMSPEQARGEETIDQRADIWSFCVLLYEVMSGKPPFDGANYNALLRAIVETRPPSLEELCAADSELSRLIELGMAKERSERWQSMQDLGEALASWLIKHGVFEDAAGGSVEAKWVLRRSDPGAVRQSRASFGSIPGVSSTKPGLAGASLHSATERRLVAEAPTSVGPVITSSAPPAHRKRRLLLPLSLATVAVGMLLANWLLTRPLPSAGSPTASRPSDATGAAPASVSAPPRAAASASASPPKASATAAPSESASETKRLARPRERTARPHASPKPVEKPGLDLMTPY